ncbi:hypothetical protein [Niveibacterium sp.]|uniref:hypothetical protein n=1 Tax=Niveibacterium sp. TaxID=2017444 RepID=UPI0035AE6CAE
MLSLSLAHLVVCASFFFYCACFCGQAQCRIAADSKPLNAALLHQCDTCNPLAYGLNDPRRVCDLQIQRLLIHVFQGLRVKGLGVRKSPAHVRRVLPLDLQARNSNIESGCPHVAKHS